MVKIQLIKKLQQELHRYNYENEKSTKCFLSFLIKYLKELDIPQENEFDSWRIDTHIAQIVADAYETLRLSDEQCVALRRRNFELGIKNQSMPDLLNIGSDYQKQRAVTIKSIQRMLTRALGETSHIGQEVYSLMNAEQMLLDATFQKFIRQVHRKGLYDMINKETSYWMSGIFGKTQLITDSQVGRIMFIFKRTSTNVLVDEKVVFVADDLGHNAFRFGLRSLTTSTIEALDMIGEVIKNWPSSYEEQVLVFRNNEAYGQDPADVVIHI